MLTTSDFGRHELYIMLKNVFPLMAGEKEYLMEFVLDTTMVAKTTPMYNSRGRCCTMNPKKCFWPSKGPCMR